MLDLNQTDKQDGTFNGKNSLSQMFANIFF